MVFCYISILKNDDKEEVDVLKNYMVEIFGWDRLVMMLLDIGVFCALIDGICSKCKENLNGCGEDSYGSFVLAC